MDQEQQPQAYPHVLLFPLPAQGHVNSMLKLAELFALAGLEVTFLNSDHNHERLVRHTDVGFRFAKYPRFKFETIPDGLREDHPRLGVSFMELFESMELRTKPILREMLVKINPPVDCIIGDGALGLVLDVADELGIPIFQFRTISASGIWAYFAIPDMIEAGELPIRGIILRPGRSYTIPYAEQVPQNLHRRASPFAFEYKTCRDKRNDGSSIPQ
ncbi:hypothetical protein QUC31_006693 [Theobroma cacao]